MKKYYLVARNMWDEMLTYRLNFTMWRVRNVFQLLTIYFLWYALIPQNSSFAGYTRAEMLTYILATVLASAIVTSTQTGNIGDEINSGDLSNFLLRPINMFKYWLAKDFGDKAMNISFSIVELSLIFILLHPPLFIQSNLLFLVATIFSLLVAVMEYFFFSLLLGFIGFWSSETWAPRFIFSIILSFFAGGLFPLDILPKPIFLFVQFLPFTYMVYFPVKIYLGQLSFLAILQGLAISLLWVGVLFAFAKMVWNRGLQVYAAQGR